MLDVPPDTFGYELRVYGAAWPAMPCVVVLYVQRQPRVLMYIWHRTYPYSWPRVSAMQTVVCCGFQLPRRTAKAWAGSARTRARRTCAHLSNGDQQRGRCSRCLALARCLGVIVPRYWCPSKDGNANNNKHCGTRLRCTFCFCVIVIPGDC